MTTVSRRSKPNDAERNRPSGEKSRAGSAPARGAVADPHAASATAEEALLNNARTLILRHLEGVPDGDYAKRTKEFLTTADQRYLRPQDYDSYDRPSDYLSSCYFLCTKVVKLSAGDTRYFASVQDVLEKSSRWSGEVAEASKLDFLVPVLEELLSRAIVMLPSGVESLASALALIGTPKSLSALVGALQNDNEGEALLHCARALGYAARAGNYDAAQLLRASFKQQPKDLGVAWEMLEAVSIAAGPGAPLRDLAKQISQRESELQDKDPGPLCWENNVVARLYALQRGTRVLLDVQNDGAYQRIQAILQYGDQLSYHLLEPIVRAANMQVVSRIREMLKPESKPLRELIDNMLARQP